MVSILLVAAERRMLVGAAWWLRVQQWSLVAQSTVSRISETAANVVARSKVVPIRMATTTSISPDSRQLDERELRAWRGMLRAHAALTKALDTDLDAAHDLPLSSYEVLMYLNDAEGRRMRMRDLAASVILSRSGLTRLADRLEREGLIRRESCPSDARGAFAVLTPAGAEKLAAARTTHLAGVRSLFLQHFSEAELDALAEAWERVVPGAASAPGPACG
jgi:DNA-binding MarR family transcriptional regulator